MAQQKKPKPPPAPPPKREAAPPAAPVTHYKCISCEFQGPVENATENSWACPLCRRYYETSAKVVGFSAAPPAPTPPDKDEARRMQLASALGISGHPTPHWHDILEAIESLKAAPAPTPLAERLREGATVLDEPFHHAAIADVMHQAADALAAPAPTGAPANEIAALRAENEELRSRALAADGNAQIAVAFMRQADREADEANAALAGAPADLVALVQEWRRTRYEGEAHDYLAAGEALAAWQPFPLAVQAVEPTRCCVVGEPNAGRVTCELPAGHEGYHRQGAVTWLGYHPVEAAPPAPTPCPKGDLACPCQDGDPCHYEDTPTTKAMPPPAPTPPVIERDGMVIMPRFDPAPAPTGAPTHEDQAHETTTGMVAAEPLRDVREVSVHGELRAPEDGLGQPADGVRDEVQAVDPTGAPADLVALVQEWRLATDAWMDKENDATANRLGKAERALRDWHPAAPTPVVERDGMVIMPRFDPASAPTETPEAMPEKDH